MLVFKATSLLPVVQAHLNPMGWPSEDQRLLLVLGRYVPIHKYFAAVDAV